MKKSLLIGAIFLYRYSFVYQKINSANRYATAVETETEMSPGIMNE